MVGGLTLIWFGFLVPAAFYVVPAAYIAARGAPSAGRPLRLAVEAQALSATAATLLTPIFPALFDLLVDDDVWALLGLMAFHTPLHWHIGHCCSGLAVGHPITLVLHSFLATSANTFFSQRGVPWDNVCIVAGLCLFGLPVLNLLALLLFLAIMNVFWPFCWLYLALQRHFAVSLAPAAQNSLPAAAAPTPRRANVGVRPALVGSVAVVLCLPFRSKRPS